MSKFKDSNGREWSVVITGYEMRELEIAGYPLASIEDVGELLDSPGRLVESLYVICKDQAEESEVSRKEFLRGFSGDVLVDARQAILDAYSDFIPSKQGTAMKALWKKALEVEAKSIEETLKKMTEAVNSEAAKPVNDSGLNSSESPELLESAIR